MMARNGNISEQNIRQSIKSNKQLNIRNKNISNTFQSNTKTSWSIKRLHSSHGQKKGKNLGMYIALLDKQTQ